MVGFVGVAHIFQVKEKLMITVHFIPIPDDVYLKLYRDPNESVLRKTYIFTKGNFVGTERGSVKRHSKYPVLYWAIILTTETVLFQDARNTHSSSDFERWNDLMKELWRHRKLF